MNGNEKQILIYYKQLLQNDVDPITISDKLFQCGILSEKQRKHIYEISRTHVDRSSIWESLLVILPYLCSLPQFLQILLQVGYTAISLTIGQRLYMTCSGQIRRFHRTPTGDSSQRFAQKLFMNFKINTHNNAFVNPRDYCHKESQKYRLQLDRYDGGDEEIRRGIADKLAACLMAEIDSHIMLYKRQFPIDDLLKELKHLTPFTSNSNVTQLSYQSRVGITHALQGKEGAGEDHLQDALGMSFFVGRCVEISNLLYIYVFNLLTLYESKPTKKFRDKIIHIAELGLQSVEDETEVIREFWFRIFTLRIIYCLLGLSYRGDPICGINVDCNSIRRSKVLLAALDRQWDRMESRRKIMYYVVKARIAELECQSGWIDTVLHFLQLALDIGSEGEYGETQFVKRYISYFEPSVGNINVLTNNTEIESEDLSQSINVITKNRSCNHDNILHDDSENTNSDIILDSFKNSPSSLNNLSGLTNPKVFKRFTCQQTPIDKYDDINTTDLKTPGKLVTMIQPTSQKCVQTYGVVRVYVGTIGQEDLLDFSTTDLKALNITVIPTDTNKTDVESTCVNDTNQTFPKSSSLSKKTEEFSDETNLKHIPHPEPDQTVIKSVTVNEATETFLKTLS